MRPVNFSILIRTCDSGRTLPIVLGKLDTAPGDQIVIVDSGSTDDTLDVAARSGAVTVRLPPPFNYSKSLNAGVRASRGDWVIVLSSHCIPLREDLLQRLRQVAGDAADDIAVVFGRVSLFDPGEHAPEVVTGGLEEWQSHPALRGGNGFAMYPRITLEQNPFDESLPTAEDVAWLNSALRRGARASVAKDAVVLYRNQGSVIHMFRKGWNETLVGARVRSGPVAARSTTRSIRSFALNSLYLTKLLLMGRFGIADYSRMISHGLGAAIASTRHGIDRR